MSVNSVSTNSTSLAGSSAAKAFLKALGAPTTPGMVRAVEVWLRAEGSIITGNNPWNLHSGPACQAASHYCPGNGNLPGQIGNRYAGKGDQNVAVFSSLDAGAVASANNLLSHGNDWTGYGRVVSAARAGDPIAFLNALSRSAWSSGRYKIDSKLPAGGSNSKLIAAFNGGGDPGAGISLASFTSFNQATLDLLSKLGIPNDPSYKPTDAQWTLIFKSAYPNATDTLLQGFLNQVSGHTLGEWAGGSTNPMNVVGDAVKAIMSVPEFLGNIGKYAPEALALLVGVPIALLGFYLLINSPGVEAAS